MHGYEEGVEGRHAIICAHFIEKIFLHSKEVASIRQSAFKQLRIVEHVLGRGANHDS